MQVAITTTYDAIRPEIVPGWCALFKGGNALGRAIRVKSEFSHVAPLIRFSLPTLADRIFTAEEIETGLELRRLSAKIKDYKGEVYLFRPDGLTPEISDRCVAVALDYVSQGLPYDYAGLLANAFGRERVDPGDLGGPMICSRWGVTWWHLAGLVSDLPQYWPTPGDIPAWYAGTLFKVGQSGCDKQGPGPVVAA